MSDVKWIKITTDIFDDEKMYAIETLQDGYVIELVWFKILCVAGKCNKNGMLMVSDKFPYTIEMLSKVFRMEIATVQRSLQILQQLEMIDVVDNVYYVTNWDKNQSSNRLEEIRQKDRERKANKKKEIIEQKNKIPRKFHGNSMENSTDIPSENALYSYSISNNNKNNFISVINLYYKDLLNNTNLYNSLLEWAEYKDNRKPKSSNHYDSEQGIKKLINKFLEMEKSYGSLGVAECVDNAMANNWQGIVWDKIRRIEEKKPQPQPTVSISEQVEESIDLWDCDDPEEYARRVKILQERK